MRLHRLICAAVFFCLTAAPLEAGQITVAAASDLTYVLSDLAARFQKQTGNSVRLVFGSSGNFYTQLANGAPFDVFLSADVDYPRKLLAAGVGRPGSLYIYATGRLVLWLPAGSRLDLERLGMNALLEPAVRRIAIANPAHAPYGRAGVAALTHFGIYERVRDKLVLGENISQAAQFVESGNADAGLIALSLATAPAMKAKGTYWEVPPDSYPRIEQAAIVLRNAADPRAAQAFLDFLQQPESKSLLRGYGFLPPEKP